jgi:hypothetical protein
LVKLRITTRSLTLDDLTGFCTELEDNGIRVGGTPLDTGYIETEGTFGDQVEIIYKYGLSDYILI